MTSKSNTLVMTDMKEIAKVIQETESRFLKVAPSSMSYDAERGFAIQALKNNQYLMQAANLNPDSLQQAITNVAAVGLSLNPVKKQAYLITRNVTEKDGNGKKIYKTKVFLEPSYMGLCDLATMSGRIEWIQARCVYKADNYENNGPGEKPTHTYNAFAKAEERGEFLGVYCVAKLSDGYLTEEMPAEEVYSIRDRSEAWKAFKANKVKTGGPWASDFAEMAKKSVVRRAFKMWPKFVKTDALEQAVDISNNNEGFEPLISEPQTSQFSAEKKQYFDQLIEQGDALNMYCLYRSYGTDASSDSASEWVNLTRSFPKGTIGKYGEIIKKLKQDGENQFIDIEDSVRSAIEMEDSGALEEALEDLGSEVIDLIERSLTPELAHAYSQLKGAV